MKLLNVGSVTRVFSILVSFVFLSACAPESPSNNAKSQPAIADNTNSTANNSASTNATPVPSPSPAVSTAVPGTQIFSAAGSNVFIVPSYTTLTVKIWGAGGGGGASGSRIPSGANGGDSYFGSIKAGGGAGGQGGYDNAGNGGAGGTASGGDTNTNGLAGQKANWYGGNGGASLLTNAVAQGGDYSYITSGYRGANASSVGGGGGGGGGSYFWGDEGAGGGGSGAYVIKTYTYPSLAIGSVIPIAVGSGGAPGRDDSVGGWGAHGRIEVTWQ